MQHLARLLRVAFVTVVAAVPAIVADPYVLHIITSHPWLATYFPVATGIVYALYRAARPSSPQSAASPPSDVGSPTMRAKT